MKILKETDRLLIRPIRIDDTAFVLELVNTKGWLEFIGDRSVRDIESAYNYIQNIILNNKIFYNVFEIKDSKIPIGIVTLLYREDLNFPDIGFAMLPDYENNGYAFEATRTYLDRIKDASAIEKIYAITKPDNVHSIKLLSKLGLVYEKTKEAQSEVLNIYSINL